jgi:hypothetical protein
MIMVSPAMFCQTEHIRDGLFIAKVDSALQKLTRIQPEIRDIHPFLSRLYPIAVVEDDTLFIFDVDSSCQEYRFQRREAAPFPMQRGIRASFPLASYGGKPTCFVSVEVFDSMKGYATIFHEFVHCTQYLTCENRLKQALQITQSAVLARNYAWEINHPFPYQDTSFVAAYTDELQALAHHDRASLVRLRRGLKEKLAAIDFEYMVWVEWKEGFARYIENEIRTRWGIDANHAGEDLPYTRVAFYVGGEMFIRFLAGEAAEGLEDVELLFRRMVGFPGRNE